MSFLRNLFLYYAGIGDNFIHPGEQLNVVLQRICNQLTTNKKKGWYFGECILQTHVVSSYQENNFEKLLKHEIMLQRTWLFSLLLKITMNILAFEAVGNKARNTNYCRETFLSTLIPKASS